MNVVLVGTFGLRPKATVSTRAVPLAEALSRRGHQVTVVTPPWDNPADSGKELYFGPVCLLNVNLPPRVPLLWYLLLTWRLLWQTLILKPDVVHVFKPKAFAGLVATSLWLLNLLGITNLRIVVDTDDWEGAGGWNEIGDYSWVQRILFAFQEKLVLRQADAITVASRTLGKMVSSLCGDKNKIFYLPNAARPSYEASEPKTGTSLRAKLNLPGAPLLLLYTRFFEFGLDRLLDVVEQVVSKVPDARLLVVGKGFFGEETELDRLAQQRGLAPYLVQAGWVEEQDLPAYFAAVDVALYPYDDTLINRTKCSVKLLDLLSAGVPVVADRVGQIAEYIEQGKSGVLIEPGDSQAMAEAVLKLLAEPSLARETGQQAQQRVRSLFTWDIWAETAEQAYEQAGQKSSTVRQVLAWLPVLVWLGLIFYMSAQPSPPHLPQPQLQTIAAKLTHLGEYGILAFLLFRAYRINSYLPGDTRRAIFTALAICVLYAISDEYHQSFVPNRTPSPIDVMIDTSGAALALGLVWRVLRPTKRLG